MVVPFHGLIQHFYKNLYISPFILLNFLSYNLSFIPSVSDGDDTLFYMDPQTAKVYLRSNLDYERQNQYVLTIQVTDNGMPTRRSSTTLLNINVKDMNDNPPVSIYSNFVLSSKRFVENISPRNWHYLTDIYSYIFVVQGNFVCLSILFTFTSKIMYLCISYPFQYIFGFVLFVVMFLFHFNISYIVSSVIFTTTNSITKYFRTQIKDVTDFDNIHISFLPRFAKNRIFLKLSTKRKRQARLSNSWNVRMLTRDIMGDFLTPLQKVQNVIKTLKQSKTAECKNKHGHLSLNI